MRNGKHARDARVTFSDSDSARIPKFLNPVSSEISDLRNFWLHTICACTESYSTYQIRWETND